LEPGPLRDFYAGLVRAEARHHAQYLDLARHYFDDGRMSTRLDELLDLEAEIACGLSLRPALH
ncbi:MAG: tRNA isopentenyl-2-thiomethyl-A-37 hydroxylase MiaE, partial [Myxococcota bacterium]